MDYSLCAIRQSFLSVKRILMLFKCLLVPVARGCSSSDRQGKAVRTADRRAVGQQLGRYVKVSSGRWKPARTPIPLCPFFASAEGHA